MLLKAKLSEKDAATASLATAKEMLYIWVTEIVRSNADIKKCWKKRQLRVFLMKTEIINY